MVSTSSKKGILLFELQTIPKKCKNHKTPGTDDIQMELLKWLDEDNQNHLLSLINHFKNGLSMEPSAKSSGCFHLQERGQ